MNMISSLVLMISAAVLPGLLPATETNFLQTQNEGEVREQINKSVALARGATVSVRGINGRVVVETWEGETAEIDITITASDRDALARRPLLIEEGANALTIRTEQRREMGRDRGWVRHQVKLRLPRAINLNVNGVNGAVEVGEITGSIGISGVNGSVRVAEAGSATEISGVNGRVTVSLTKLSEQGLKVHGINGGVEIGFVGKIDAQLDVHGTNGGVNSDFPLTVIGELRHGELRGTIGAGGPRISVQGVNGGVQIKRN